MFMAAAPSLTDDFDRGAVVQLVRPFGDHLLAVLDARLKDSSDVALGRAGLDLAQACLVAVDHEYEIPLAAVLDRLGRHYRHLRQDFSLQPGVDELVGNSLSCASLNCALILMVPVLTSTWLSRASNWPVASKVSLLRS